MARTCIDAVMAGVAASPLRTQTPVDEETAEEHAAIPAEAFPLNAEAPEYENHTPGGTRALELQLAEITAMFVALQKNGLEIAKKV